MRILPRLFFRRLKPMGRRFRRLSRHVTVVRAAFLLECLSFGAAILFLLTGSRLSFFARWGQRADAALLAAASILFGVVHTVARRRLVPRLERYFYPAA